MRFARSIVLGLACHASAASATQWPNGAKAAVALTYDDALVSQLDHAVPVLDRAGFKGTFFLANVQRAHVVRWRSVARNGHELANHTVFHACAAAQYPADPRYTAEAYTPASMVREIEQQNVLLTAIDGKAGHGYGVPCGTTIAGGKDYQPALRVANIVTYVRGASKSANDMRDDVSTMDPYAVPARDFPEGVTSAQLIDFARSAESGGGMAVYVFHGVGGDYLQTSDAAHRELIDWLAAHRRDVWVAPLGEVLAWAKAHPSKAR